MLHADGPGSVEGAVGHTNPRETSVPLLDEGVGCSRAGLRT